MGTAASRTNDAFRIDRFFEGRSRGWGIVEDRFGTVRRTFVVDIEGFHDGGEFVMDESFLNGDGSRERRTWRVSPLHEGRFTARAHDVVGTAQGRLHGAVAHLRYSLRLDLGGRQVIVSLADRLMSVDRHTAIARARMSKWGVTLGHVTILFRRERAEAVFSAPLTAVAAAE